MAKMEKGQGWPALSAEMSDAGVKPTKLAELLGVNRVTVYKWLGFPNRRPDMERIPTLALALAGDSPERAAAIEDRLVKSILYPALSPVCNPMGD